MAEKFVDGTGTTVTFSGGDMNAWAAEIVSVDGPSIERGSMDNTNMSSTNAMEYIAAKLYDAGTLDMTVRHVPATAPPILTAPDTDPDNYATISLTSGGSGTTKTFQGFMTAYSATRAIGARMEASISIKCTGEIT